MKKTLPKILFVTFCVTFLWCLFVIFASAEAGGITSVSVNGGYYQTSPTSITVNTNASFTYGLGGLGYVNHYWGCRVIAPSGEVLYSNTAAGSRFAYGQNKNSLNQTNTFSPKSCNQNGTYKIEIYTYKNNSNDNQPSGYIGYSTFYYNVDHFSPSGTIYAYNIAISSGSKTNAPSLTYNASDPAVNGVMSGVSKCYVKRPQDTYYKEHSTSSLTVSTTERDGTYSFYCEDAVGNRSATVSVIVDRTAPTGTLSGVANGGTTNGDVSFTWSEGGCSATLNGTAYSKGTTISSNGYYRLILKDEAGNSTIYTFTIDKIPPVGTLTGVANGGIANGNVSFTWSESGCSATLNGASYAKGTTISTEGKYTIILRDTAGNSTTYTFEIDKTAPTGTLSGVANGGITNGSVYFMWSEGSCTATLDGKPYTKRTTITAEGLHTIVLTDTAGNKTTYTFEIDKTAPEGTLTGVKNGGITNGNVSFTWTDNATATLNNESYTKGTTISKEGKYTIVLTDEAGNSTTYTFTIDKTRKIPTLHISGDTLIDGGITNKDVWITWTDSGCTAKIRLVGGTWEIYLQEYCYDVRDTNATVKYPNEEQAFATIYAQEATTVVYIEAWDGSGTVFDSDREYAAVGDPCWSYDGYLFFRASEQEAYLQSKVLNYCCKVTKNYITAEGTYEFILTDAAGNTCTRTFTIDKTAPTGELTGVANGGVTNGNVTISWTEDLSSVTVNGVSVPLTDKKYTIRPTANAEIFYQIIVTDAAGNSTTYTFTIDTICPSVTLRKNGKTAGLASDGNYYFKATDKLSFDAFDTRLYQFFCDEDLIESDASIDIANLTEGVHTITVIDAVGNSTSVSFIVDKTAPTGTLTGVANGGVTNGDVSFTWSERNITASSNGGNIRGVLQADGSYKYTFSVENGQSVSYTIVLTDLAGNTTTYTFVIDKVAPEGTLTGVTNGGLTNGNVSFTWTESGCVALLDGSTYNAGDVITAEGTHTIILRDAAGNTTTYTFEIDKTAPTGTLSGVTNGGVTNGIVKLYWVEGGCTATLNGKAYVKSTAITAEGVYTLVLTDKAGNSSTYTFEIDKTAPTGTLSGVTNGSITKGNVRFTWSEKTATATLNGYAYTKDAAITAEGAYTLVLTDAAGNSTIYTFEIDKTAPIGELTGVENGGVTNSNVSFSWTEKTATASLNGEPITSNTVITAEGTYTLMLTDEAGNTTTYTFVIDKTAPTGTLSGVENGGITNGSVSFVWSEKGCVAALNGNTYNAGDVITAEGTYTLVLTDAAGNSTTYTFTIDKNAPKPIFSVNPSNTVSGTYYFNRALSISWKKDGVTATIDGNTYNAGDVISDEGTYKLILTDTAGNKTTATIVIDKTPYRKNYEYILSSGNNQLAKWYQTYYYAIQQNNCIKAGYYAFANRDDALTYAVSREMSIIEAGGPYAGGAIICSWAGRPVDGFDVATNAEMMNNNYYIYFDIADSSKLIAYFDYNNLLLTVNHYAEQSIETRYIPSSPASAFPGDDTVPAQLISRPQIFIKGTSFSWRYAPTDVTLYINGVESSYDALGAGWYNIREVDLAGNVTEYVLVVDPEAPKILIYDASGNRLVSYESQFANSSVYFSQPCTLQLNDNYDTQSLLVVTCNGKTQYLVGDTFTFTKSGIYTIKVYDVAGNSATYTVYVSLETPTVSESDVLSQKGTYLGKDITIEKILDFNNILSLIISQYDAETDTWVALTQDANGTAITAGTLKYFIATSGDFKVVITDNFGRTTEKKFSIYKDAPIGKLFGADGIQLPSGSSTQKIIYFQWDDDSCTATINGLEYTKKALISAEGTYTIVLTDLAGNSSTYTITIDKTAPTGTLTGVANGGYTNGKVSFTWDPAKEAGTLAYISRDNGDYFPYTKDTVIDRDGYYRLKLVDAAGNETVYTFRRDTTAPAVSIVTVDGINLPNGSLTNKTVYFQWAESGCTATVNGEAYSSKQYLSASGTYTFHLRDLYGNFAILTVTIDKVAPEGVLAGVSNGGITNGDASFTWSESGCTVTLDGSTYNAGDVISSEGLHTIVLTDKAGNSSTYTFEIDKTAPTGTLSGVANRGITNGSVFFTWSESGCTVTLDGAPYTKKFVITAEGTYTIVLTDEAGNSTTYTFTIDKTAPAGDFSGNYVTSSGALYFRTGTSFSWSEGDCSAELNGNTYNAGDVISDEGTYTLILTDAAGNSTTYTFVIDKTAPVGYFSSTAVFDGQIYLYRNSVYITWTESGITATLDGAPYTKRTTISDNGEYTLVLTDLAGNSSTYTFVIDNVPPEGSFSEDYLFYDNVYYFNRAFWFTWTENGCTATLDGNTYNAGEIITDEGTYTLVLTDAAGNSVSYIVVLDMSSPIPTFSADFLDYNGVLYFKDNISITWAGNGITATLDGAPYTKRTTISAEGIHTIVLTDRAGNSTTYTFVLDKTAPVLQFSESYRTNFSVLYFKSPVSISWEDVLSSATLNGNVMENHTLLTEGTYEIILTDRAGNEAAWIIIVDQTAPEGTLVGVANGGITNGNVSFTWSESGCTATLDGATYKKGNYIYDAGTHTIVLTDLAGNSTTYTFTIDFNLPEGTLTGVANGGATNSDVFFSWTESGCTATLDDEVYINGTVISAEGRHTIVLTNEAGNSTTYTFEIDRTAPEGVLVGVANGGITNGSASFAWSESGCDATLDGAPYTKRTTITAEGLHTIVLTDAAGNSSTYTFEIDRTAPTGTLTGVANGGITNGDVSFSWPESSCSAELNGNTYNAGDVISAEGTYMLILTDAAGNSTTYTFTIDKTAPVGVLTGVTDGGITSSDVSFTWSESGCVVTLDGVAYTKRTAITEEGTHTIVLTDLAGNSTVYTFTIDRTAPAGELIGVSNGGITNGDVSFTWSESGCTVTLDGSTYNAGDVISSEGLHTIVLTDKAGNSSTYTFEIDKTAPEGTLTGANDDGITNVSVSFDWIDRNARATLNGFEYSRNTVITAEGTYTIVLTDAAGNSTTYTFTIDKTAPAGDFSGNYVASSGALYFRTDTSFSWTEDGCSAELNGNTYNAGDVISDEGTYTLILTDAAGNTTTYTFVIDKTAPVGVLTGVENNGASNSNVSFTWTDNATATLNGSAYKKGSAITSDGSYVIVLTDAAGNTTTYTFVIDKTAPIFCTIVTDDGEEREEPLERSSILVSNGSFTLTVDDQYLKSFTFNGEPVLESDFLFNVDEWADGTYTLEATDLAGNLAKIFIIVDKTAPTGDFSTEPVETENGLFFTSSMKFTWSENDVTATLNDEIYRKGSTIYTEGTYTLVLTDAAGNSTTYTFTLLLTDPSTTIVVPATSEGDEEQVIKAVAGRKYVYSQGVSVGLAPNATVYVNGEAIDADKLLSEPGEYRISIKNAANVEREFTITILESAVSAEKNGLKAADIILIIVFASAIIGISVLIVKNIVKAKKIRTKRL